LSAGAATGPRSLIGASGSERLKPDPNEGLAGFAEAAATSGLAESGGVSRTVSSSSASGAGLLSPFLVSASPVLNGEPGSVLVIVPNGEGGRALLVDRGSAGVLVAG
jgi:hypothetical protein